MLLILVIILVAGIFYLTFNSKSNKIGNYIKVTVDGKIYGTYSLDNDQRIEIKTNEEEWINIIVINEGKVHMEQANCPDGYCIDKGNINKTNQTIVCLPHKVVVEIIQKDVKGNEVDDVVK
jgi:hypothetical protein